MDTRTCEEPRRSRRRARGSAVAAGLAGALVVGLPAAAVPADAAEVGAAAHVSRAGQASRAGTPAVTGRNGRIAFARAGDIYTVLPNGKGEQRLTDTGDNSDPAWSPDGTKLAFVSRRTGSGDVYTIPAAGGDAERITTNPATEARPAWSPDGTFLAFLSDRRWDGSGLAFFDAFVLAAAVPHGAARRVSTSGVHPPLPPEYRTTIRAVVWMPGSPRLLLDEQLISPAGDAAEHAFVLADSASGARLTEVRVPGALADLAPAGDRVLVTEPRYGEEPGDVSYAVVERTLEGRLVRRVSDAPFGAGRSSRDAAYAPRKGKMVVLVHRPAADQPEGLYLQPAKAGALPRLLAAGGVHPSWQGLP